LEAGDIPLLSFSGVALLYFFSSVGHQKLLFIATKPIAVSGNENHSLCFIGKKYTGGKSCFEKMWYKNATSMVIEAGCKNV